MPKPNRSASKSILGNYVPLPGSRRDAPKNATCLDRDSGPSARDLEKIIDVEIALQRKNPLPAFDPSLPHTVLTTAADRRRYEAQYGADEADIETVAKFAADHGLKVGEISRPGRTVQLLGTIKNMQEAFLVELHPYQATDGTVFRGRVGVIHVPVELKSIVHAVLGLDNRPIFHSTYASGKMLSRMDTVGLPGTAFKGFTGSDLAALYNFPAQTTGAGQTIGILELGGGYVPKEVADYFQAVGVAWDPANLVAVGKNDPKRSKSDNVEVLLDIEVAGAAAPGAKLVVYFAPDASSKSFLKLLRTAVHDTVHAPQVLSISWGGAEADTTDQYTEAFHETLDTARRFGITVCVAAGDNGSADFPYNDPQRPWDGHAHVDHPAADSYALACGGTRLRRQGNGFEEEVWHAGKNEGTGGGVSRVFGVPDYQAASGVPDAVNPSGPAGRGVPDLAGNAAQESGYRILCDGHWYPDVAHNRPPVGGTSAVAPLMAALFARLNQALGHSVGFPHALLYGLPAGVAFRDIVRGNNGDYAAGKGWDACTGLGVPHGEKLLAALRSATIQPVGAMTVTAAPDAPTERRESPSVEPPDYQNALAQLQAQVVSLQRQIRALSRSARGSTPAARRELTARTSDDRFQSVEDGLCEIVEKLTGYRPEYDEDPLKYVNSASKFVARINARFFSGVTRVIEDDLQGNNSIAQVAQLVIYVQDNS